MHVMALRYALHSLACGILLATLIACGGTTDSADATPPVDLRVTLSEAPEGPSRSWSMRCAESQVAEERCAAILAAPALHPSAADAAEICTQEYAGPQAIAVRGVVDGAHVDVRASGTDGCGIASARALWSLVGEGAGPAWMVAP